jgi:hypothetical protein
VSVVCCQVEVFTTSRSLLLSSPTDCGAGSRNLKNEARARVGPQRQKKFKKKSSLAVFLLPDKKHVCHKTLRIKLSRQRTGFLWSKKLRERHVTIKPDLISGSGIIPYLPENSNLNCQNYKKLFCSTGYLCSNILLTLYKDCSFKVLLAEL